MPEVCRFNGIVIRMFFADHEPPDFHAEYGGSEAQFGIALLLLLRGKPPPRAHGLVVEWASAHQPELREAWRRVQRATHLGKIKPLA